MHIMEFFATLLYAIITIFAFIGAIVYARAYVEMKRTPIIGAVVVLLFTISMDAFWWFFTEFERWQHGTYETWMVSPIALIVIKLFLTIGVLYFVLISIHKDKVKKCL